MNPKVKCFSPRPRRRRRRRRRRRSQRRCHWNCRLQSQTETQAGGNANSNCIQMMWLVWMMSWLPDYGSPAATINNLQQLKTENTWQDASPKVSCRLCPVGISISIVADGSGLGPASGLSQVILWATHYLDDSSQTVQTEQQQTRPTTKRLKMRINSRKEQPASVCLPFCPKKEGGAGGRKRLVARPWQQQKVKVKKK